MSKRGYLILGVLLLALVGYLAWPQGGAGGERYELLAERPAGGFTLSTAAHEQVVRGERVTIDGVERPLDPERVERLWSILERMASAHEPIPPGGELAAYGIGPAATRLLADRLELRWGVKEDTGWVFDAGERRLYRFDPRAVDALEQASARLDRRELLRLVGDPVAIEIGDQRLEPELGAGGEVVAWRFAAAADRPPATGRVHRLIEWLRARELEDLAGRLPETAGAAALTIRLTAADDQRLIELYRGGDGAWLRVAEQPPQPLDPAVADELTALAAAFERDLLFDLPIPRGASPVSTVTVTRGDELVFRAERGDLGDTNPEGASTWELTWSGGRETASADVGRRFLAALVGLPVTAVEARDRPLDDPPPVAGAVETVELGGTMAGGGVWLQLDGERLAAPGYTARAEDLPELLRELAPGSALSRELLRVPPARLSKLQRVRFEDGTIDAEVLRRGQGGWTLVVVGGDPAAPERRAPQPVSASAVQQLVGAVLMASAETVALATPADLGIREDPGRRELALRIDPLTIDKASDLDRVEETATREWGLAMRRLPDGGWEAVDFDGVLRYRLDHELVEQWFAPVRSRAVLAIQPSRVERIAVTPAEGLAYDLVQEGGDWAVVLADDRRFPADPTSLRAYLGTLARLEAERIDPEGLPLAPDGSGHGLLELELPGFDGRPQRLSLVVGPLVDGRVPASTGAGRLVLRPEAAAELFPVVGTFLAPADLQRLDPDAGG